MLLYKRRSPKWLQQLTLLIGISLLFLFPTVKELGMSFSFLPKNVVELEVNWYPFDATTIERNYTSPPPPPTQQNHHPTLPTILFVTFVHLQDFSRFEKFIFPALDTFLQNDTYFVVLSQRWETKYHTELCTWNHTYSTYCKRIRPIFVDCPEGYFGIAPCCKQEKGLLQISKQHPNADWILYMDDDIYIRSWHLKKFLSQFDPSNDAMLVTAGGKRSMHRPLGQTGYSRYPSYPCSKNANFTYPWGRPVLYSRAARDIVIKGWEAGGMVQQCLEFRVLHDVGNAIFHWIYSLPVVNIRLFGHTTGGGGQSFGAHGVNHETAATITGQKPLQNMYQVHETFTRAPYNWSKHPILWHNVSGFHKTKTYQAYGDPTGWKDVWHTVPHSDCWDPTEPSPFNKDGRLRDLQTKCANIMQRLEERTENGTWPSLRQYEIPCGKVFQILSQQTQSSQPISETWIQTLQNETYDFPLSTPWEHYE